MAYSIWLYSNSFLVMIMIDGRVDVVRGYLEASTDVGDKQQALERVSQVCGKAICVCEVLCVGRFWGTTVAAVASRKW